METLAKPTQPSSEETFSEETLAKPTQPSSIKKSLKEKINEFTDKMTGLDKFKKAIAERDAALGKFITTIGIIYAQEMLERGNKPKYIEDLSSTIFELAAAFFIESLRTEGEGLNRFALNLMQLSNGMKKALAQNNQPTDPTNPNQ